MRKQKVILLENQQPGEIDAVAEWISGETTWLSEAEERELAAGLGVELVACLRGLERYLRELAETMRISDDASAELRRRKSRRRKRA